MLQNKSLAGLLSCKLSVTVTCADTYVMRFCGSFIAEKGRVTTAAVEINSATFFSNSGSSTTSVSRSPFVTALAVAGDRSQIRAAIGSAMWMDVSFRVLVGSDRSAIELGITFSNLISGGIWSDQLNREVRIATANTLNVASAQENSLGQLIAAPFNYAYLLHLAKVK